MIPDLTEELVAALEAAYPNRCRSLYETERAHDWYAGKVELIASLRSLLNDKEDE